VLGVADQVLWPAKTTNQLHLTQAITLDPGAEAQALHRDQWCFDFFPFPDDVEVELATMWALTDFTEHNGATRVVPGSNRLTLEGIDLSELDEAAVPAVMPRGSVVIYSGRTVHGGGRNDSDQTRIGVNIDYVLGWLRQQENQYLVTPPEVARHLPEDLQRLVGYTLGAYALGYVHELRDPVEVLRDGGGPTPEAPSFAPKA
jgi:ectoine hydroxylase-related dioxygenase (phytanoyl-CoA dioxygenase family)